MKDPRRISDNCPCPRCTGIHVIATASGPVMVCPFEEPGSGQLGLSVDYSRDHDESCTARHCRGEDVGTLHNVPRRLDILDKQLGS